MEPSSPTHLAALAVDSRLAMGLEVDEDSLDRWVWEDPDLPLHIVVVTQYGVVTAGPLVEPPVAFGGEAVPPPDGLPPSSGLAPPPSSTSGSGWQ